MQKFKQMRNAAFKAVYAGERTRDSVWHARGWTAANEHGKFVYGANNTLTQAARWRIAAHNKRPSAKRLLVFMRASQRRWAIRPNWGMLLASARAVVPELRILLDSAKRGGCYLP